MADASVAAGWGFVIGPQLQILSKPVGGVGLLRTAMHTFRSKKYDEVALESGGKITATGCVAFGKRKRVS